MRGFVLTCAFCTWRESGRGDRWRAAERYGRHVRGCAKFRERFEAEKPPSAEVSAPALELAVLREVYRVARVWIRSPVLDAAGVTP